MSVFERIVVGIDGRCGGRDALALAALVQRVCGGEVTVSIESGDQARTRAARAGAVGGRFVSGLRAEPRIAR